MDIWGWHSPLGLAIFLLACGVTVGLLAWSARWLAEIQAPPAKRK